MTSAHSCFACGQGFDDDRFVIMRGKVLEEHCSEDCLRKTVRRRKIASATRKSRWVLRFLAMALLLAGGSVLWHLVRAPQAQSISFDPAAERPARAADRAPTTSPIEYGPPWPPTDADWLAVLGRARWIYPLPGPQHRTPTVDNRILGADGSHAHARLCRTQDRCAVDLGGELWGEHVYAVHDGVVDGVHRALGEEHGGPSIRLAHIDGTVFTHYSNLAAIPLALAPGTRVKAGDVIGLVGDSDTRRPSRHLYFALSTRAASTLPEMYWDPAPWIADWPLHLPVHGTVAGFVPAKDGARDGKDRELVARRRR